MKGTGWERVDGASDEAPTEGERDARRELAAESGETYRPLRRRAKWVIAFLLVGVLADSVAVVSDLMERSLLADAEAGALISREEADSNDLRQLVVGAVQGTVFVLTAVVFLFWFHRAYRNLTALGAGPLRFGYGWAVGAWFVPFLNLWRPKQIANDIWRASDPSSGDGSSTWKHDSVPLAHLAWWLAYVITSSLYSLAFRRGFRADELGELQEVNTLYVVADSLTVAAGGLALLVVHRTTRRQTACAEALGLVPREDPTPLRRRKSAWAAGFAAIAALGLQALLGAAAWTGTFSPENAQGSVPNPRPPAGTEPGALFADDFSETDVWLVHDDSALTLDYVDDAYRVLVKQREGFWSSAVAFARDVESMSAEVDATMHSGRVRTDYYGVACVGSTRGGFFFGISPDGYYSIDLDPGGGEDVALETLVEDFADRRFGPDDAPARLKGTCTNEGDGTVLTLDVNGTRMARTTYDGSLGRFAGVAVFAYSGSGGTDVRFDDLVVLESSSR
ncbi:MAG: DUF4328 domain-containing protein [Gaiellaceae bacterium]